MPDRGDREPAEREEERWPDRGFGDRGGAGRSRLADYEGGYGGGRDRANRPDQHEFGERGWSGSRDRSDDSGREGDERRHLPEGVRDVGPDDRRWQERYARENSDKYGQAGGHPIARRGPSSSMGGFEHREGGLGNTRDISPRGGYGARETERWAPEPKGEFAGRGPKNFRRGDERICEDVCQRLTDHPAVDATEIEVTVTEGEVTLTGTVDSRQTKRVAEDIAAEVSGVKDVHNQIRVQSGKPGGTR